MLKIIIATLLFAGSNCAIAKHYVVHNEQELNQILQRIQPGDKILIANGTYLPWSITVSAQGTAAKPITIQAQTTGKVVFSGDTDHAVFKLTGSYVVLKGITFTGCSVSKAEGRSGVLVEMSNTKYCRLTECVFTHNTAKAQFMPIVIVSGKGEYNTIDHCTFSENVDNQEVQIKVTRENTPLQTVIEHNVFKDKSKVSWKGTNGGECVQVGQDPILLGTISSYTTVRDNLFTRCNGEPEVISNKSSNNHYVRNRFEECDGELVMRGGHDCVVESNIISGGNSGIRVNGTGHQIIKNVVSGTKTGIRLMYGMAKGKSEIGFYIAASDCIINDNRIENVTTGIFVGDSKNVDWTGKFDTLRYPSRVMQDVPPANNTMTGNIFIHTGTEVLNQN